MRVANWHIHSWPSTSKEFVNPQWRQHSRYKLSINCCLLSIRLPRYCTEFVLSLEGLVFVYWGNISTQWGLIFYISNHLTHTQTTKAYQPFRNSANRLGSPPSYAEGGARGSTLRRARARMDFNRQEELILRLSDLFEILCKVLQVFCVLHDKLNFLFWNI